MKRIVCVLLLLAVVLTLTSCEYIVEKTGTSNVGSASLSDGTSHLLPNKKNGNYHDGYYSEFNDIFQSVDENAFFLLKNGGFAYLDDMGIIFVYFTYDDETYEQVKEYSKNNFDYISEEPIYSNEKYVFYSTYNQTRTPLQSDYGYMTRTFAYNDDSKTLVFFGASINGSYFKENFDAVTDFNTYLQLFSEYYDFTK